LRDSRGWRGNLDREYTVGAANSRFSLGEGWLGKTTNWIAVVYILFECVILSFPVVYPITAQDMK